MSTDLSSKRIIITGSNGYIGSHLVKYFSKLKNFELICITNKKENKKILKKNIKYIKHNLLKKIPKTKIKENIYAVLHFAGPKNDREYVNKNKKKVLEGIKIDKNIINFSVKKKIKIFIYASSAAVYELSEGTKKNPFREENIKKNSSYDGTYGYTKKFTENYLNKISIKKLKSVSCRIFSIYGKNTNTIINIWKKKILKNKEIDIWGKKKVIRSWLHLNDLITAIYYLLEKKHNYKIVNIGSNERTSLIKIANIIGKKFKKKVRINYVDNNYPGPTIRFADQKKMKLLGWRQKIYLNKGLDLI
tara:strand:- start:563 stop:1474 length:912 start_codon:yes stop_codon:yes gene_type:complete